MSEQPRLDRLWSGRVAYVTISDDRKIATVWEHCDDYFSAAFNKENPLKLAEEIKAIAQTMEDI